MDRAQFLELIGQIPKHDSTHYSILSEQDCDGYRLLKIEYGVEAGEVIPAYVLRPSAPLAHKPAIYCHHQHASDFTLGKSEPAGLSGDPDQAIAPELARRGYLVLVPDSIAFEERNWSMPTGHAEYHEMTSRIVQGRTLIAKVLGDVVAGLNVICTFPDTNPNRIGFIGHSYGGRMAIWAPAFDSRIKASVSNCGCVNYKDSLARTIGIQAEFCIPGVLEKGDIEDIVRLISPRALFISATDNDKYSMGAQGIYEYAKDAFPKNRLKLKIWHGDHQFTLEMRKAAYDFLDDHLA